MKKKVKSKNFYLSIIDEIQSGNHPSRIASSMGLSKQSLNYYIRKLKSEGIIEKKGYGVWEVKKEVKEFSLGTRPTTNLHALQINFPILKGKIMDSEWQLKEKLNNWIPKYKENINTLGGLTFKNNNNKSLTVFVHSRDISSIDEVDNLAFKVRAYVFDYFRKEGVTLDVMNCKTTNLNLATQDKEIKPLLRKGEKYELDLHKKAEPIFQQDNINAKAWLDNSPKPGSAETNDKEWKREYLNMPFRIKEMFDIIEAQLKLLEVQTRSTSALAENIKSHIPSWMSNRKVEIELRKLNRRLSERQTTLTKD